MTLDEQIHAEMMRVKPEFTEREWFALANVIESLIRRLLTSGR